jgi:ubiquinone/menaquinone biosynthesis C-methylase UbiE
LKEVENTAELKNEAERIRQEYQRRDRCLPEEYYSFGNSAVLFSYMQRGRAVIELLKKNNMFPLAQRKILDVGCGTGSWLADFEMWGSSRENLAGIELDRERGIRAKIRFAAMEDDPEGISSKGADIRIGDASHLPWSDAVFDIVIQSTVFTSILLDRMKEAIAREMSRVLKPGGIILWYDFFLDNPKNPNVKGVRLHEIRSLFPSFDVRLSRITLAPPIARRIVPITWIGAMMLEYAKIFNSHYLGCLRKPFF